MWDTSRREPCIKNVTAGIANHLAGVFEHELVFTPRSQRFRREYQKGLIARTRHVHTRGVPLKDFRGGAIHGNRLQDDLRRDWKVTADAPSTSGFTFTRVTQSSERSAFRVDWMR